MSRPQNVATFTLVMVCLCSSGHSQLNISQNEVLEVDTERGLVLEALKTGILSSLGMDKPPILKQKASQQELIRLQQLYEEKLSEMGLNSSHINRIPQVSTLLLPDRVWNLKTGLKADSWRRHIQWHRAVFHKMPSIQDKLTLVQAELQISRQVLERPTPFQSGKVKVRIRGSKQMRCAVWTDITSDGNASQRIVLDVSAEVQKWIENNRRSLVVDIGHKGGDYKLNVSLRVTQRHKTRTTRSNKEDDCDEQGLCCRQSITVSFKDIGWTDWVVAPLEYTMHFCQGACPHNYKPASMHTQVKSRLHQISNGGMPQPCCIPAAYEPMVLMHYDSRGKLKLTPFEDLIVSNCHCA